MRSFTFLAAHGWVRRLIGRNPLVRTSDRIEAVATALAVVIVLLAVPVAAAVGTAVHDSRAHAYAEQAATRHQVTATAVQDSTTIVRPNVIVFVVRARWNADGRYHDSTIDWPTSARAGDQTSLWVDARGEAVEEPAAPGQAGLEAVGAAVSLWLGVALAVAVLAFALRWRLDLARFAAWDRALRSPVDGDSADGGRPNRSP